MIAVNVLPIATFCPVLMLWHYPICNESFDSFQGLRHPSVVRLCWSFSVVCFALLCSFEILATWVKLFLMKTTINGPPARSLGFHRPVRIAEDFSICILLVDPERLCADAIGMTLIWFQVTGIASAGGVSTRCSWCLPYDQGGAGGREADRSDAVAPRRRKSTRDKRCRVGGVLRYSGTGGFYENRLLHSSCCWPGHGGSGIL